ncbi:MAG: adenosylmethionine decarboxylase [Candidatus Riflebacteria bacterium]|nr:adenosylmethionine decarboxylase [Candidatus Riflebacteria bacterium]
MSLHILADFYKCDRNALLKQDSGLLILEHAIRESGLGKICTKTHQFEPFGYTAFALLAESHIAVHTWPESEMALIDIFACGAPEKAEKAYQTLVTFFSPEKICRKEIKRGLNSEDNTETSF